MITFVACSDCKKIKQKRDPLTDADREMNDKYGRKSLALCWECMYKREKKRKNQ